MANGDGGEIEEHVEVSGKPPDGWASASAYDKFKASLAAAKTAKAEADAARAELAAAKAEAATARQQAADVSTRYSVDLAIVRAGITDAEDIAEIRDRYSRVEPGEDGKRPAPSEWLGKLKEAPPRWFKGYLDDVAPKPSKAADPTTVEEAADPVATGARVEEPAARRAADPNAGVVAAAVRGRKIDDAAVAKLTGTEWAGVRGTVAGDLAQEGQIKISDALRKKLGAA